jgi:hypothetical protein
MIRKVWFHADLMKEKRRSVRSDLGVRRAGFGGELTPTVSSFFLTRSASAFPCSFLPNPLPFFHPKFSKYFAVSRGIGGKNYYKFDVVAFCLVNF